MNEGLVSLVVILLPLSFISERLANLLKLVLPLSWFGNLTAREKDPAKEKKRELKILSISLAAGLAVSFAVKADLFSILHEGTIGWNNGPKGWHWILGCLASGLFLSWGSKFWHDLMDLLLEIKNGRKAKSETRETESRIMKMELAEKIDPGSLPALMRNGSLTGMETLTLPLLKEDPRTLAKLDLLHPSLRQEALHIYEEIRDRGVSIRVTDSLRTFGEQNALFAKGRTEPGKIVTYAKGGQSFHNYGLALDFCLLTEEGRQVSWDRTLDLDGDQLRDWDEVVSVFKHHGWDWGGDWARFKDYPHFEKANGFSTAELLERYRDGQMDPEDIHYVNLEAS